MPIIPHSHTLRWLDQELPAWEQEGLLTPGAADKLRARYASSPSRARQLGVILVSAFGACLIGAGVISLFAYNWDNLDRPVRAALALLPLVVMQTLAALTLWRWKDSAAVRESVCGGLILAIGAAIGLIAQTYQIGGDFAQFMLTWFALALPAVYLLRSGLGFWLCQIGLLCWGGYAMDNHLPALTWIPALFAALLPYYFWIRHHPDHPVQSGMNKWALALSAPLALWFWTDNTVHAGWPLLFTTYFAAGFLLDQRKDARLAERPFALVGALLLAVYMLIFSFDSHWAQEALPTDSLRCAVLAVASLAWLAGVLRCVAKKHYWLLGIGALPLAVLTLYALLPALSAPFGARAQGPEIALTLYTLAVGALTIAEGVRRQRLLVLNLGLLLLGALAVFRFFDSSFGLVAKGTGFILVGGLFIAVNIISARLFKNQPHSAS